MTEQTETTATETSAPPRPLEISPEFKRRARVAYAKRDPGFFFRYYFTHYCSLPPCDFHEFAFDVIYRMSRGRVLESIIGSRDLAKSAIITRAGIVYATIFGFRKYAVIVSSDDTAQEQLQAIVHELENNERLHQDFGDAIRPKKDIKKQVVKYSDKRVVLKNGTQIRSITLRQSLRGKAQIEDRVDLIVGDDPQADGRMDNWELREADYTRVVSNYLGALVPDGAFVVLANRGHKDSVASRLEKNEAWTSSVWPMQRADGKSRWPERWSDEKLAQLKVAMRSKFDPEFNCAVAAGDKQVFYSERFHRLPMSAVVMDGKRVSSINGDPIVNIHTGIDPSSGFDRSKPRAERKKLGDFAVVGTACKGESGTIYALPLVALRDSRDDEGSFIDRQVSELARQAVAYSPDKVLVENVNAQRIMRETAEKKFKKSGIAIRPMGEGQSVPKHTRIYSTEPDIGTGLVVFVGDQPPEVDDQYDIFTIDDCKANRIPDDVPDLMEMLIRNLSPRRGKAHFGPSEEAKKKAEVKKKAKAPRRDSDDWGW